MMPLMKVDTGDLRRRTLLSVKPMGGAGVPVTGMETDDMFPMNPEGTEADDIQVQRGHLSMIVHVGQTPF
ncbi:hypothetical protein Metig_0485 [Methanotorris igneus Kol 5]|uniref:Uncharacterized protein n=1 Tax=Methanotorris igneus (strain DSM 5666 / JCM 11834 / Kol 5) TaxID=880724 RepID=F6BBN2_METIK|nr:hypothetical protein Metig_0485 [Methanotorris igneus Kol 5]